MSRWFQGLGVAPGVALGSVYLLHADAPPVVPEPIPPERVAEEAAAFHEAREAARRELDELRLRVLVVLGERYAGILEAQMLVLDDPRLIEQTVSRIHLGRVSARWALREVFGEYARKLAAVDDDYLRDRGGDLEDLHRRLQRLLRGESLRTRQERGGPLVAVAHGVGPADAVDLARRGIVALATDAGGRTSHTAILAQALGVPAVAALGEVSRHARPGDPIVVDGDLGTVVLLPTSEETATAAARRAAWIEREERVVADGPTGCARTADGAEIELRANVEFPEELAGAVRLGARGIGLYRSEFLFLSRSPALPTEEEHFATYVEIARGVAPHPAVVRTLDLGGEKYFHDVLEPEQANPVLGLRAVRFCLQRPDIFRPQLRGLLRAGVEPNLRVMLPMVTNAEEIQAVRRMFQAEARALAAAGQPLRADIPLGMMVEVPAAAVAADVLTREVDFVSIGTNDLIQYALAVDRGSEKVSYLYRPEHPGVLRLIGMTVEAAARRSLPCSVCGEMAADPAAVGLLVGLGVRELSLPPRSVPLIRDALRRIDADEARRTVERMLE